MMTKPVAKFTFDSGQLISYPTLQVAYCENTGWLFGKRGKETPLANFWTGDVRFEPHAIYEHTHTHTHEHTLKLINR